tara:strand:+ start:462 stop:788 length:327 start_codon:yes stop_codon:yes gene_type:complete
MNRYNVWVLIGKNVLVTPFGYDDQEEALKRAVKIAISLGFEKLSLDNSIIDSKSKTIRGCSLKCLKIENCSIFIPNLIVTPYGEPKTFDLSRNLIDTYVVKNTNKDEN